MRVAAAVFSVLALGAVGCHKQAKQAYSPPPPPSVYAGGRAPSGSRQGGVVPQPVVPPPSMKGRPDTVEEGLASWYGPPYHNRKGADGTVYDENAMTAAHKTLPMGSMVRVTNLSNGQSVVVRITDRGPFVRGRIIDLSLAAAKATGVYRAGVAKVRVEAYLPATRPGADPGGRWCVQIGAFLAAEDAIQLKNDLIRRYATAKVIEFAGPTGYWVRINPQLPDKSHADQIVSSIHVPDAEPYLIRTD
ncbi:septal ring lytic transglycosylase RlpA family protein [Granulicella arctica]|nr:septal ring lytic transglycosylase RlpA family protein [Granulicella arctica]